MKQLSQFWNVWRGTIVKTIERKYITLAERKNEYYSPAHDGLISQTTGWDATANGTVDTGERIYLVRFGKTAQEAYRALEFALHEQDWEIV